MRDRGELAQRIDRGDATVAVVGLGYVGLAVACAFATAGFTVRGLDIDRERARAVASGEDPLDPDEPGLAEAIRGAVASGRLGAATDPATIRGADVHLIAVDTPVGADARPDENALRAACATVGTALAPGALIVVESTVAPGTTDGLVRRTVEAASGLRAEEGFFLGHCPERVRPGALLRNIRTMERVCGGASPETAALVARLYRRIASADLVATDLLTAELVKTAENAWYDVNIAFANEVALMCESLGADVERVRELVNRSPGRNMLVAGAGVGGACIPKDPWLLAAAAPAVDARLIRAARAVNDAMPAHVVALTRDALARHGRSLRDARIAVLGASYRENTRDDRNSPTGPLVRLFREGGAEVRVHDPHVGAYQRPLAEVTAGADAAVVMVAHDPYRRIDVGDLRRAMRTPVIVDGRRAFDADLARSAGFTYVAIGAAPSWS